MSERTEERESTTDREAAQSSSSDESAVDDAVPDRIAETLSSLESSLGDSVPTDDAVASETTSDTATQTDAAIGADTDADAATDADETEDVEETQTGRSSVVTGRLASAFSPRHFLLALALATGAGVALGTVLPYDRLGNLLGVFLAGATVGLVVRGRHYLEVTAAGALTAGVAMLLGSVLASIVSLGAPAAFGVGAGAIVAFLGHYAGRDLRSGFQREV